MRTQILKYSVGIDVSKPSLEVCFSQLSFTQRVQVKGSRKFANNKKDFALLHQWIEKYRKDQQAPLVIVMEATGVYHEAVAYFLDQAGYDVCIVLPNKARKYMQSLGLKSKNDTIDRKGLAQMGAEQRLPVWQPPSESLSQVRALSRQLECLEQKKTDARNQLHAQQHAARPNKLVIRQLKSQLKYLNRQKQQIQQAIEEWLEKDPELSRKIKLIAGSIKGLGLMTLATILAETDGFKCFNSQAQLTSYAGYDVVENQSGKRAGKTKISKRGNAHIRRALHFPALNMVRHEVGTFPDLYQRVYDRSAIKMKAYVAVQRKLLCLIYSLWKKNEAFDPDYARLNIGFCGA